MRTFIAIKIVPEPKLLTVISNLKGLLADEPLKWVDEDRLHLTLKFLGDTSPEQVEQVKSELSVLINQLQPITIVPEGLGYFKSRGMPRVLYINITGSNKLKLVADLIEEKLIPFGFKTERRAFKPHLTLARIKFIRNREAFYAAFKAYENIIHHPVEINEIIYFESILGSEGPVYNNLSSFRFQG